MKAGEETITHIQITNWVKQKTDLRFYHFPNEGKRGYVNADILGKMGMTAGVYDLLFPRSNEKFKGMWLEIKSSKGRLSKEQKQFRLDMIEEGYGVYEAWSFSEAVLIIKSFYSIE